MHDNMGGMDGWHWGFGFGHWFYGVIIWVAIIALVIFAVKMIIKK